MEEQIVSLHSKTLQVHCHHPDFIQNHEDYNHFLKLTRGQLDYVHDRSRDYNYRAPNAGTNCEPTLKLFKRTITTLASYRVMRITFDRLHNRGMITFIGSIALTIEA